MDNFITLTCPSCGGKLQITDDIDRFACGYCGAEHIVKRSGGIVAIAPVVEEIKKVQAGVDKTAAELAIVRLSKEIDDIAREITRISNEIEHIQKQMEAKSGNMVFSIIIFIVCISFFVLIYIGYKTENELLGIISGTVTFIVLVAIASAIANMFEQDQQRNPLLIKKKEELNQKQQELRQKYQELEQHKKTVSL